MKSEPCPFCRCASEEERAIKEDAHVFGYTWYRVTCSCGACGPHRLSRAEAVEKWNAAPRPEKKEEKPRVQPSALLDLARSVTEEEHSTQSALKLARVVLSYLPTVDVQEQAGDILTLRIAVGRLVLNLSRDQHGVIETICDRVRRELLSKLGEPK